MRSHVRGPLHSVQIHKQSKQSMNVVMYNIGILCWVQREITRKLTFPKQPTNPFLEMVKFLLERIAPVHIDSEAIRSVKNPDRFNKTSIVVGLNLTRSSHTSTTS